MPSMLFMRSQSTSLRYMTALRSVATHAASPASSREIRVSQSTTSTNVHSSGGRWCPCSSGSGGNVRESSAMRRWLAPV